jgi:hypothetical protein
MFQPTEASVEVFLQADADDGGSGPTQYPADIYTPSGVVSSYTVPAGQTLEVQQVALQLVHPATGESAWGAVKGVIYNNTTNTRLIPALLETAAFPPGPLSADYWCQFETFFSVPAGQELILAVDNPGTTRSRARFTLRGWLRPTKK